MTHAENRVRWCLNKAGREGRKHRGLMRVEPDPAKADGHIAKAEHNLRAMEYLIRGGFSDWAIHASFYAHYHCLLAILQKHGYESRNQECTFAAVEALIEGGKVSMEKAELARVFSEGRDRGPEDPDMTGLRERFQYGIETAYGKRMMDELLGRTRAFIERAKAMLQE